MHCTPLLYVDALSLVSQKLKGVGLDITLVIYHTRKAIRSIIFHHNTFFTLEVVYK